MDAAITTLADVHSANIYEVSTMCQQLFIPHSGIKQVMEQTYHCPHRAHILKDFSKC